MGTEKDVLVRLLDEMPPDQVMEVLDFAAFVHARRGAKVWVGRRRVKLVPADRLRPLLGCVAWGGDAVSDSERLYDNG